MVEKNLFLFLFDMCKLTIVILLSLFGKKIIDLFVRSVIHFVKKCP